MQALQAATINPARFLGKDRDLGTVEEGKLADLILLDANPVKEISNIRRIRAVVVNGRYLDQIELQRMMKNAEAAVAQAQ